MVLVRSDKSLLLVCFLVGYITGYIPHLICSLCVSVSLSPFISLPPTVYFCLYPSLFCLHLSLVFS